MWSQTQVLFNGRIPSKKNSKRLVIVKGKPMFLPSIAHKKWHKEAMLDMLRQGVVAKKYEKAKVDIHIYFPDKRKADLTNKAESIMDILVDYGVLLDDCWQCVDSLNLSGSYTKERVGANVIITKVEE